MTVRADSCVSCALVMTISVGCYPYQRTDLLIEYSQLGLKLFLNNLGPNFCMRSRKIPRLRGCLIVALEEFALDFVSRECLIVALEAFALDFVSSADHTHYTAFQVCTKAALVDSPVHKAEMAALALLVSMADSRAVVAGSRAAAGSVRYISAATDCPFSTSNSRLTGGFLA